MNFLPSILEEGEAIAVMKEWGLDVTQKMAAVLKMPRYVTRRDVEKSEFFDIRSIPPKNFKDSDSPLGCYKNKLEPPAWISEWYLQLLEEEGKKFLLLAYRPKKVFVKCEAANAESIIAGAMQRQTINPRAGWSNQEVVSER